MNKYKNFIFDMDGTLIDSFKLTHEAFKIVCPKYNLEMPSDELIKKTIGFSAPEFYYRIFPTTNKDLLITFGEEVENVEKDVLKHIGPKILFDDVDTILNELLKQNIEIHIASTGNNSHVSSCLKASGIYDKFKSINCNEPDKEDMLSRIINGDKTNWVMIGDKRKDSNAAKANKIYSIGAGYGYCFKEDYETFDEIIFNIHDVLKFI